jgi:type IX secretion system PorP/SprF family membrane protein
MRFKCVIGLLIVCLSSLNALAQDAYFTQQYASKLYLNPAFAGVGHQWGISMVHRNQWPALNGSFKTNQIATDFSISDSKSAVSLILQQDRAGIGGLQKLQVIAGYAYHTRISDKWNIASGLQASLGRLSINFDNLVFGDQLSDNGKVAITSAEINAFEPSNYYSFAVGGLVFSNQFWAGLKAGNLNIPNYRIGSATKLPITYVANVGYKFYAKSYYDKGNLIELSFTPSATYIHQSDFKKLDIGLHTIYTPLTLGIVYRGVPVVTDTNQDQVISVIAGLQIRDLNIGFSHDVGVNGFSKRAGGANEITLVFDQIDLFKYSKKQRGDKIKKSVPCPAF